MNQCCAATRVSGPLAPQHHPALTSSSHTRRQHGPLNTAASPGTKHAVDHGAALPQGGVRRLSALYLTGMLCRVNGRAVKEEGFETHAVFGRAAAQDCAVLGSDLPAHCGSASELRLVPAGPLADHRAFLGSEKVHVHVRGAQSAEAASSASRVGSRSATRVPASVLLAPILLLDFMCATEASNIKPSLETITNTESCR